LSNLVFFQRFRGEGDSWVGEIETTLTATKNAIESLSGEFDATSAPAIVIVGSLASDLIADDQPLSYHVGKAGLNQMVRYYAVALGPIGIRVNAVTPGIVLKEEARGFYQDNPRLEDRYKKLTPLGRMGSSEDIAQAIIFLCGPSASFITGQNLVVDGGVSSQLQQTLALKLASWDAE
jgi:NAD(P)-dependent dehydrogenase (short-subunit alcohol dehydrogenase family)